MSKILSIFILFLSISVQAALPKELPAAPAKFLTGACLTRTEDLWITAEAGGIGNVPNRRSSVFGNSRRSFVADIGFRGKNVRSIHEEIIHPRNRSSSPPSCHGRQGTEPTGHLCQLSHHASMQNSCNWSSQMLIPHPTTPSHPQAYATLGHHQRGTLVSSPLPPRRHLTPEPPFLLLAPHLGESRPKVFEGERPGNVPGHDAMHDCRGQEPQP